MFAPLMTPRPARSGREVKIASLCSLLRTQMCVNVPAQRLTWVGQDGEAATEPGVTFGISIRLARGSRRSNNSFVCGECYAILYLFVPMKVSQDDLAAASNLATWHRYCTAVIAVLAAVGVHLMTGPILGPTAPY